MAAQISSGSALDELYARQIAPTSAELDPGVGVETITELFFNAITKPGTTRQKLRRIGAIAAATDTVAEPVRREVIAGRLPSHHWPDRDLRLTAIDIVTGERVVFDRESGVDLVDAVAASCAVPGAWPPVTIGERRYMDGGVASSVNLDIAADCDVAVVLVPSSGRRRRRLAPAGCRGRGLPRSGIRCVRRRRLAGCVRSQPAGPALPGGVGESRAGTRPARRCRPHRFPGRHLAALPAVSSR
ncbi:patatin-like phospholipase family protein [Mycobacterium xenopi 4042]|uniref:Patatin-like phospholipase family protein n=1 Tax=Mycobacterium xenopi 4042 TaxID=1299334 RepID=X8AGA6_MYCXE|nr:patatin-like phospholipase family protein [Mycobacterium xenopi 4042]